MLARERARDLTHALDARLGPRLTAVDATRGYAARRRRWPCLNVAPCCRDSERRLRGSSGRIVTERGRESPYYRKIAPCERGGYFDPDADAPDDAPPNRAETTRRSSSTRRGGELFETTLTLPRRRLADLRRSTAPTAATGCQPCVHAVENVPTRWGVLLDEDAFVAEQRAAARSSSPGLTRSGHAAVGVPDGGVFPRRAHNPNALNLFFNVLDLDGHPPRLGCGRTAHAG